MKFKLKASIVSMGIILSASFFSPINAYDESDINLNQEYESRQIIEKNIIEDNEDELFYLAKENKDLISIDENGNEVYTIIQTEEVAKTKSGETIETLSETTFQKVDDGDDENKRASITHDGWDKTSSAFIQSTTNYSILGNYVKLNSCKGSVSRLNSGVQVQNLTVRFGSVGLYVRDQIVDRNYGKAKSFSWTAPSSWEKVPNQFSDNALSSVVGSVMKVKLGRSSSSTWTQEFTNQIGRFSNRPL